MNKVQVKQIIKRARTSFVLVIVAAVLSQVFNIAQYAYTRSSIKRQTSEKAYRDLREIQRIVNLKTNVETAVQNAMGDVLINLQEPDKFYGIASRLVSRNEHIVGCAIAMKPGYYPEKDSLFAPFAYPESKNGKNQPRTKLLPYDYTEQDWYIQPLKADSAIWSEPYTDTGGSGLLIHTYGQPIHNNQGDVIGILTADVHFKDLAQKEDTTYSALDRVNIIGFILQLLALILIIWIVWRFGKKIHQVNRLIAEQDILSKELQIASDIQAAMLPKDSEAENARHHLNVEECLIPAPDVSADFYDYFYTGKNLVFCIGDVPGSNVKAALMMSVTRSIFRTSATMQCKEGAMPSPAAIVTSMNNTLCTINHNQMFATLLVGVLNLDTAKLTYCNAGNPAPVVLSPATGANLLDANPNIPVGIMEDYEYMEQSITLIDDFTLFIYNDGLYETENSSHEPYGQKRMLTRLKNCALASDSPQKILSKMQEALESYRGSADQSDDVLMVTFKTV